MIYRGEMTVCLHIHCGDWAAKQARLAPLDGEVLVWRDSPAVGPIAAVWDEHRRLRAAWWAVDPAEMQDPRALPEDRPIALWFGPDPWEQMALVELLAGAPGAAALSVVPLERGVGESRPDGLAARFERRVPAPERAPLRQLWADFCADDRPALDRAVTELRGHPQLPHLGAALARVLAERRDRTTALRVRALVHAGVRELPALMQRLRALEAPKHGVWYGDSVVARLRDAVDAVDA
jgi:hypothetical protein